MDVQAPDMDGLDGVNGEQQLEPVDLCCRVPSSTLGVRNKVCSEPLDLSTTPRASTSNGTMEPYYYNHQYPNQFSPNHADPSIYRQREPYSGYQSRTHNVSSEYRRTLPYYWNTCMYNLGNNQARNHVPAHSPNNQWKSNASKSTCAYEEVDNANAYMTRPSCVFSERRGVNDFGNWREMYSYTEVQDPGYSHGGSGNDCERNMVLTNGGSCKYSQQHTGTTTSQLDINRGYMQQEHSATIPQYSASYKRQSEPPIRDSSGVAKRSNSNLAEIFVSNNKLFAGGCVVSTKQKCDERSILSSLPPIAIPDFVIEHEENDPDLKDARRQIDERSNHGNTPSVPLKERAKTDESQVTSHELSSKQEECGD